MEKQSNLLRNSIETALYAGIGATGVCIQSLFGERTFQENFIKEAAGLLVAVFLISRFTDYLAKRRQSKELEGVRRQFIEVIVRRTADVAESGYRKFANFAAASQALDRISAGMSSARLQGRIERMNINTEITETLSKGNPENRDEVLKKVAELKDKLAAATVRAQQRDRDLAKTVFSDDLAKASLDIASALRSIDEITDDVDAIRRFSEVYLSVIPHSWSSGVSTVLDTADFQVRRLRNLRNYLSGTGSMQDRELALKCDVDLGAITRNLEAFLKDHGLRDHVPSLSGAHAPVEFEGQQRRRITTMSKVIDEIYYTDAIAALE